MDAAYKSLFNGRPIAQTERSPWPAARPYVIVWCPHRRRCRLGAVYATRWGYLWLHVMRNKLVDTSTHFTPRGTKLSGGYTLLTYPDGTRRDFGHLSATFTQWGYRAGCRHWTPTKEHRVPFIADEMFALLDDVQAGRIRRPADYVATWSS
jgi:hypothetical protein